MDYVIGIDPGITGAVVVLKMDGSLEVASLCPSVPTGKGSKREFNFDGMRKLIEPYSFFAGSKSRCAIEHVGPMAKQGVTSMFNFGRGFGIWIGIVCSHIMPLIFVKPKRWQGVMLDGYPKGEATKQSAVIVAKAMWPDIPIEKKKDWGIADAALIAEWNRINSSPVDQNEDELRRLEALKRNRTKPREEG